MGFLFGQYIFLQQELTIIIRMDNYTNNENNYNKPIHYLIL